MYFEPNSQALLAANPAHSALLQHLDGVAAITDFQLLSCPDGNYTLQYKGMCLHDAQSPLAEAREAIAQNATLQADRIHAVLGLGLGYLVDELFHKTPGHIAIFEPDLGLLRFVLENVDLTQVLKQPRIALFATQPEFLNHVRGKLYSQYKLDVLALRGCAYFLADYITPLMEQLTRIEQFRIQDFNTGKHFHLPWIRQFFQNAPYFAAMDTLDRWEGAFKGKPALVISRGPSLDQALPAVKALQASTVQIAVGGALHHLYQAGITPDFALFYDANGMREQVHGLPEEYLSHITFVMSPFTQPFVYELPCRGRILMLAQNNNHLADFWDEAMGQKHLRLAGGGTVSIIALQLGMKLGCESLILVGQDLAFPNERVYAGGTAMRLNAQGQLDLETSETLHAAPYNLTQVTGQDGSALPTTEAYKSFLIHLEEIAAENAQAEHPCQLWNASLGGANIQGFALRDLQAFVGTFPDWKAPYALPQAPGFSDEIAFRRRQALLKATQLLSIALQDHVQAFKELSLRASRNQSQIKKLADLVLQVNQAIYARLIEDPFTAYLLIHETRSFREAFQETLSAPDGPVRAQKVLKTFFQEALALLEGQLLPVVREATAQLSQQASESTVSEVEATA